MDCQKCNQEMVLGYIQSSSLMIWSTKKRKATVFADYEDDVIVGDGNYFVVSKEAFRCPCCGTIVIPDTV